jgi:hypothetical protein
MAWARKLFPLFLSKTNLRDVPPMIAYITRRTPTITYIRYCFGIPVGDLVGQTEHNIPFAIEQVLINTLCSGNIVRKPIHFS